MGRMLRDKVAIVTGSAQGIGRGIAQRLASGGAALMLADVRTEAEPSMGPRIEPRKRGEPRTARGSAGRSSEPLKANVAFGSSKRTATLTELRATVAGHVAYAERPRVTELTHHEAKERR